MNCSVLSKPQLCQIAFKYHHNSSNMVETSSSKTEKEYNVPNNCIHMPLRTVILPIQLAVAHYKVTTGLSALCLSDYSSILTKAASIIKSPAQLRCRDLMKSVIEISHDSSNKRAQEKSLILWAKQEQEYLRRSAQCLAAPCMSFWSQAFHMNPLSAPALCIMKIMHTTLQT